MIDQLVGMQAQVPRRVRTRDGRLAAEAAGLLAFVAPESGERRVEFVPSR
jgi:hypothetical protein